MHYFATTDTEKEAYRQEMRPLAKKYSEFLHFTITDANEYPGMLAAVGLEEEQKTGLALENPNTGDLFPFTGRRGITAAAIETFLDDITSGRLQPVNRRGGQGQRQGHDEL
jgi:protein disulfide-isomerase A1